MECFEGDVEALRSLKQQSLPAYTAAIEAYFRKDLHNAHRHFQQVLDIYPNDPVSGNYLLKIEKLLQDELPQDWTGIEVMQVK